MAAVFLEAEENSNAPWDRRVFEGGLAEECRRERKQFPSKFTELLFIQK